MRWLENILASCIIFGLMSGCATFRPRPISPSQTAAAFEARTLDNPGLKEFLEVNLQHEITPWPPRSWSLQILNLVAFYYHPDLDVARAKWGTAKAGVMTAGGLPNPSVAFTPQYNANAAGGVSPWTLGFTLDIPIETAGKRGYRIAQVTRLSEATRLNIASVAWEVSSRLRKSLLNLYSAEQSEAILKNQRTVQQEIVKLLEERLTSGEVSIPDVTQTHISLDQTRLSLHEAERQRAEARVQLADALGLPVAAIDGVSLSFDLFDRNSLPKNFPSQDIRRQTLLNRADILSALAEYAATESTLQLEIAKQYPDIHIGPGYQWDQGANKWSLGLSVSLPILNRNEGPIAEAEARRIETQARFSALQARVIGELDRALAGYVAALQKLEAAESLLLAQRKQQESVQSIFDAGGADRLVLHSAQIEYSSAELSRSDALVKTQQALGALEDAMQRPLDPSGSLPSVPERNPRTKEEKAE